MIDRLAKAAEEADLIRDGLPTPEELRNYVCMAEAVVQELRHMCTSSQAAMIDTILNEQSDKPREYTEYEVALAMARTAESMGWKLGAITDGSYELLRDAQPE